MKIIRIIRSKFKNKSKIKDEWYLNRIEICKECPLNSMNSGKRNLKYYFWKFLNFGKSFCTICGCEIKAKASEEMEICSLGEMGQEPKWKQEIL